MKRLWFGEQDISQKRFKKFLRQAGHPTRNGTACWTCWCKVSNWSTVQQTSPVIVGHKLWILVENKASGLTAFVAFTQFKTFPSLRCAQMPYMEQYPSAGTTLEVPPDCCAVVGGTRKTICISGRQNKVITVWTDHVDYTRNASHRSATKCPNPRAWIPHYICAIGFLHNLVLVSVPLSEAGGTFSFSGKKNLPLHGGSWQYFYPAASDT